ncbi:MAG: hypothetical protein QME77_12785 [bacterium]|nr:hypothetical protein [bacterium]
MYTPSELHHSATGCLQSFWDDPEIDIAGEINSLKPILGALDAALTEILALQAEGCSAAVRNETLARVMKARLRLAATVATSLQTAIEKMFGQAGNGRAPE